MQRFVVISKRGSTSLTAQRPRLTTTTSENTKMVPSPLPVTFLLFILLLSFLQSVSAIKFSLPAFRYPAQKCIWNAAHANSLVIVTANVGPGLYQRVDIEIVDSGPNHNVYLSKKGIKGESRLAITTHSEGEVGVCLRNYIEGGML